VQLKLLRSCSFRGEPKRSTMSTGGSREWGAVEAVAAVAAMAKEDLIDGRPCIRH
jgi:hypothetical protein